ncbi:hypothetical protein EI94DRAFT_1703653 [Lactarius quietus]|nr:hypothetical protein EI94DRAFT_1703653 [Lactarius quietus]
MRVQSLFSRAISQTWVVTHPSKKRAIHVLASTGGARVPLSTSSTLQSSIVQAIVPRKWTSTFILMVARVATASPLRRQKHSGRRRKACQSRDGRRTSARQLPFQMQVVWVDHFSSCWVHHHQQPRQTCQALRRRRRNGERKVTDVRGCFGLVLAVEPGFCPQLKKQEEVEKRILDYCIREGLYEQGVAIVDVTNTGWHGESSSADLGGHITVHFLREDGRLGNLDTLGQNTPLPPSSSRYDYRYCCCSLSTPYRAPQAIAKMPGHYDACQIATPRHDALLLIPYRLINGATPWSPLFDQTSRKCMLIILHTFWVGLRLSMQFPTLITILREAGTLLIPVTTHEESRLCNIAPLPTAGITLMPFI